MGANLQRIHHHFGYKTQHDLEVPQTHPAVVFQL